MVLWNKSQITDLKNMFPDVPIDELQIIYTLLQFYDCFFSFTIGFLLSLIVIFVSFS